MDYCYDDLLAWYFTSVLMSHFTDAILNPNGRLLPNHSLLSLNDFPLGSDIRCMASGPCCSLNPRLSDDAQNGISPSGTGSWRYPNGSYVLPTIAGSSFGITRHSRLVNLHRRRSQAAEGVWRCEVPGNGNTTTLYTGIYMEGHGMHLCTNFVAIGPIKTQSQVLTHISPKTILTHVGS
jgi:hypothetical protein